MSLWTRIFGECAGCRAKDEEIDRLSRQVDDLTERHFAAEERHVESQREALRYMSAQADLRAHLGATPKDPDRQQDRPRRPPSPRIPMAASHLATKGHMPTAKWHRPPPRQEAAEGSDDE